MGPATGIDALLLDIGAKAKTSKNVGDWVEAAVDIAMSRSPLYSGRFAWTETWSAWAKRNGKPVGIQQDIGVDRVITTVDGRIWLVQTKGHDIGGPARTRVDLPVLTKLLMHRDHVPGWEKLIIVTTGAGVTANVSSVNSEGRYGVVVHNREWLRGIDGLPETVEELKSEYNVLLKTLTSRPPSAVGAPGNRSVPRIGHL